MAHENVWTFIESFYEYIRCYTEIFWNSNSTVMRHNCYDYVGKIWNESESIDIYVDVLKYLL